MKQVYLDHNASTPLDPGVAKVMRHAMAEDSGNPSSTHWAGLPAQSLLRKARQQVADLLGCSAREIIFTSGGSEANNLALKGVYFAARRPDAHIITTAVEHPATLKPCAFLQRLGARITHLPVDAMGQLDPDELRRAMTPATILVSVMHANNEVGTILPVAECAQVAREHGVPLHTDAAQSVGKISTRVDELGVDALSIAGHKIYAPKGVGALYVREGLVLEPLIHGAGHERGRRAGTESVLLAGALGQACELAGNLSAMEQVRSLRDQLWSRLRQALGNRVRLNGHAHDRLPNTLNVSFLDCVGSELLAQAPNLAASTGSACHADRIELSPVLAAMGVTPEQGAGAIRLSLGRSTTAEDIHLAADWLLQAVGTGA